MISKYLSAPFGGAGLSAQAREQVQRALALVESGPADDTLKTQVTRLQAELEEADKDLKDRKYTDAFGVNVTASPNSWFRKS